jgi:MFS family permease
MSSIFNSISNFLIDLNPVWVYLTIFLAGLFIYWRGCTETRKNRSSIFDTFLISILSGVIMGRVSYLVINWSEYSRYAWYFLPYERYGDTVYLFRLLPWRLVRIWDGGLTIFVAMIAFLILLTLLALFYKKWRWYQVYFPIFFSMTSMLGLSFAYLGIVDSYNLWIYMGIILFLFPSIFWAISKILLFTIKNGIKRRKVLVYIGVLLVTIASLYISYEYISDDISTFELVSVITLLVWTAVMNIFTIVDVNRPNVEIEKVSSVRAVDIEVNQPIRIK